MIVATAGHIDHGKTTLVRLLTGVDTDRLPEEKARGISIDLGFAYGTVRDGVTVGFVDVPGHERFIRNMLAGVCGIDYVLLVVAADDGPMRQTLEHLQIVDLLGIDQGLAIITKIDRVPAARIEEVSAALRSLLASTSLAAADVLAVSATEGTGVEILRQRVAADAARHSRSSAQGQRLRLAIDRAFSIKGSGTVVTGSVFAGEVRVGDRLVVSPSGLPVRVRGLQARGQAVERAQAGERCALNLAGVDVAQVGRGAWVLAPELHGPTRQIDVQLRLLADNAGALRHWAAVHVHLGTADVLARIAMARGESLQAGETTSVRLVLDRAIVAAHGDRFIIRDPAVGTLGGGTVLDPHPPRQRRLTEVRSAQLQALQASDAIDVLTALQGCSPAGLDVEAFLRSFNRSMPDLRPIFDRDGWLIVGKAPGTALPRKIAEALVEGILVGLARFHAAVPEASGIEIADLRLECAPRLRADLFTAFLRRIAVDHRLEVKGSLVRSLRHAVSETTAELTVWQRVRLPLEAAGFTGVGVAALARTTGVKEAVLRDVLHRRSHREGAFLVDSDLFYAPRTMAAIAVRVESVAARQPDGRFTAAAVRDELGVNRTRTVQLLECLDRLGITQRNGNVRVLRKPYQEVLGDVRK